MSSEAAPVPAASRPSQLIFLGTGSSSGTPHLLCLTQPASPPCAACSAATLSPPEGNPNYRTNPSLLVRFIRDNSPCLPPPCTVTHARSGASIDDKSTGPCAQMLGPCGISPRLAPAAAESQSLSSRSSSSSSTGQSPGTEPGMGAELRPRGDADADADGIEPGPRAPAAAHRAVPEENPESLIQIDCGKNWREQVLRWYPLHAVPRLPDALLLTHDHADAIHGLRDMALALDQRSHGTSSRGCGCVLALRPGENTAPGGQGPGPLPVYLSEDTLRGVQQRFPELYSAACGRGMAAHKRFEWRTVPQNCEAGTFRAAGLRVRPLPVFHGEGYVCLGFEFGERQRVVYISDISEFCIPTKDYLLSANATRGRPYLLILDMAILTPLKVAHVSIPESLDITLKLNPVKARYIGMSHSFEHERVNDMLQQWSIRGFCC